MFLCVNLGIMFDDMYDDREIHIERAVDLLPPDLASMKYRRQMRGTFNYVRRKWMPDDTLNYDPMVPYMAPYMEEAKLMLQEEMELIG